MTEKYHTFNSKNKFRYIVMNLYAKKEMNLLSCGKSPAFSRLCELPQLSIAGVLRGQIIFYHYEGEDESRCMIFSESTVNGIEQQELGIVPLPEVWSGSCVAIGHALYSYQNHFLPNIGDQIEPVTSLVSVDTSSLSMNILSTEVLQQSLVYMTNIDNTLYALKGTLDGMIGTTYIESFNPEEQTFKTILKKTFDNSSQKGHFIRQFCSFNGNLYTLSLQKLDESSSQLFIEEYTPTGKLINQWNIGHESVTDSIGKAEKSLHMRRWSGCIRTTASCG